MVKEQFVVQGSSYICYINGLKKENCGNCMLVNLVGE